MRRRWLEVCAAGTLAGVVVACGSNASHRMGEIFEDAGQMLADAGTAVRDAATPMLQDAGDMMSDAGDGLRDVGTGMQDASGQMANDASAQACAECANGAVLQVPADQNMAQLGGGVLESTQWIWTLTGPLNGIADGYVSNAKLVDGPFVVTDLLHLDGSPRLFLAPTATECLPGAIEAANVQFAPPEAAQFLLRLQEEEDGADKYRPATHIRGARVVIPAGTSLCATGSATNVALNGDPPDFSPVERLYWSGFAPY